MIRIDAAWLATAPLDMRAGTDTALARVVAVFGAAHPHTAYLFANKRANRIKILVHDGIGSRWRSSQRSTVTSKTCKTIPNSKLRVEERTPRRVFQA